MIKIKSIKGIKREFLVVLSSYPHILDFNVENGSKTLTTPNYT